MDWREHSRESGQVSLPISGNWLPWHGSLKFLSQNSNVVIQLANFMSTSEELG